MTIVEKLRKLITTKGGDPTGVMTIAEGVDRLEKTEEGGGGSNYHGFSPWPVDPTNSARVYCYPNDRRLFDVRICRDIRGYNINDEMICYFGVSIETDTETGAVNIVFSELVYTTEDTPSETDIALCEYVYDSFKDYARDDVDAFTECLLLIMGDGSDPDNPIPGPSFYVML